MATLDLDGAALVTRSGRFVALQEMQSQHHSGPAWARPESAEGCAASMKRRLPAFDHRVYFFREADAFASWRCKSRS
jgi:hypothetical protein